MGWPFAWAPSPPATPTTSCRWQSNLRAGLHTLHGILEILEQKKDKHPCGTFLGTPCSKSVHVSNIYFLFRIRQFSTKLRGAMQCFQWNKEQARVIYDDRMKSSLYRIMIMPWIRSHQGSLCAPPKRWEAWTGFNHLEQYPDQIFKPPCIFTSYLPFGVKGLLPPGCSNDSIGHKAEHIFRGGLQTWKSINE